jgi:hypothetical protein
MDEKKREKEKESNWNGTESAPVASQQTNGSREFFAFHEKKKKKSKTKLRRNMAT